MELPGVNDWRTWSPGRQPPAGNTYLVFTIDQIRLDLIGLEAGVAVNFSDDVGINDWRRLDFTSTEAFDCFRYIRAVPGTILSERN